MVDEIGMDELVAGVEVAFVEEFLEHSPRDLDVGLRHRVSTLRFVSSVSYPPLRGNYPGSYPETASAPAQTGGGDFDWWAAAVGATAMLGFILLLAAGRAATRMARNRRGRIPFVVDVRDDTPTTS